VNIHTRTWSPEESVKSSLWILSRRREASFVNSYRYFSSWDLIQSFLKSISLFHLFIRGSAPNYSADSPQKALDWSLNTMRNNTLEARHEKQKE